MAPTYSEMKNALENLQAHVIDITLSGKPPKEQCVQLAAAAGQATSVLDDSVRVFIKSIPKAPMIEAMEEERRLRGWKPLTPKE